MIRYALLCPENHGFEAWFRDSDAFDRQSEAGQVTCPTCGGGDIRKAVMAPAVRRSGEKRGRGTEGTTPETSSQAAEATPALPEAPVIADESFMRRREALRQLHAKLKRDAVDVGPAFPDQARRIHDGDAPPRAIYGTAVLDEGAHLVEDGVGIMPIPALPDDRD